MLIKDDHDNNQSYKNDTKEELKENNSKIVSQEDFEKLQTEFNDLQVKFDEMTNQLKRAVADYQNLEKRVADNRSELITWSTSELIKKLLPVLDNMIKALNGAGEEEKKSGWFKGVEMSLRQLQDVLKSEGLDEIAADGQFDPSLHEAVDIRDGEDNKILEVVRIGYTLNGKILRPAQVVVGKKGDK